MWYRHNQRWLQASKEGTEASKRGSFKNEREWGKKCFEDLDQRRMGRPVTRTWSTDFLLREGSSREEIGKRLKNKSIPWQRRRRLLQVVTGTFPCGQQMVSRATRKQRSAHCVRRHMRRVEAAGTESCQRRRLAIFRVRDAWDKRKWSLRHTMRASGSCCRKLMRMGRRTGT